MPPPAELPGFLGDLAPVLDRFGYLAIAGIVGVEGLAIPAPGQTIVVAGALYAGAGRLNIAGVATVGFLAAVVGDNLGYWMGRAGGRRLVLRYGRYLLLTPGRLDRAEHFFTRHGAKLVAVARFIDGLRQVNGIMAGVSAMPWRRFLVYDALGTALWVALWTSLGYLAGDHIVAVYDTLRRYQWYAVAALGALVVAYAALHITRRHRRSAGPGHGAP
jgi:membrane protein DedA with SNARE-associated domain